MRRSIVFLLLLAQILHGFSSSSSELSETSLSYPNRRVSKLFNSLLPPTPPPPPPKADLGVVAALDGTIYLVDSKLGKIRWSFSSGRPIYSSYQASTNQNNDSEFYIDVGKDWELYWHSKHSGEMEKLPLSAEEYIRSTPYITEDGGVILGAKNTTVFLVDAMSGTVVHTYGSDDSRSSVGFHSAEEKIVPQANSSEALVKSVSQNLKKVRRLVYVMRTDYELLYHSPNSKEVLWNVKFAHIEAEFRCQRTENSFSMYPFQLGNELTAEFFTDAELPLPCQTEVSVYQLRDNNFIETLSILGKVGGLLSLPAAKQYPSVVSGKKLPLALPDGQNSLVLAGKKLPLALPDGQNGHVLALPQSENENPRMLEGGSVSEINNPSIFAETTKGSYFESIIALFISLASIIGFFFYRSKQSKLNKQVEELKVQVGMSKKKKSRRLGNNKNNANSEKMQKVISHETKRGDPSGPPHIEGDDKKFLLTFNNVVDARIDGRRIGKLIVSNKEIAKGSNGTVVLEGIYDGRPVAVKRLVQTHHDVALKEIQNLIVSDRHPNIVRWYGVEFDQDFVYLSLERCTCSLSDLIYVFSGSFQSQEMTKYQDFNLSDEFTIRLRALMENNKDVELWKENGHPSAQLLKLMRDMVSGVSHLHELGIIHRDLKPPNVLIITERSLCAKLSDMGISKRLLGDMSTLTQMSTKADLGVVAALDGTIYLVDSKLGKIRWSFSSGRPIYSSYQASTNQNNDSEFYIDVGKDWELYWHSKHSGEMEKLPLSAEEYIRSTPYITEDGGVILGAKNTTVFLVDAMSGTVVHTYGSDDSRSSVGFHSAEEKIVPQANSSEALVKSVSQNLKKVRRLVYVMRTDYELLYHSPNSKEVLWNVKFAHIEAEFRCQRTENSFSMYPFQLGNELTAEFFTDAELPLPCQTEVSVYQLRDNNFIETLSILGKVGGLLSLPAAKQYPSVVSGKKLPLALPDGQNSLVLAGKKLPLALPDGQNGHVLALPQSENENPRMLEGGSVSEINNPSIFAETTKGSYFESIIALFISLASIIGFFFYRSKQSKLNKQVEELKVQVGMSKKKKSRRLGNNKNNANSEKMQKVISHETKRGDPSGPPHIEGDDKKFLLTFNNVVDARIDGRRIGKLIVSNKEIAKGSNGTVVLEGIYDGRPVAVKRLVQTHHDVALKEIQNLIVSDRHPNIVRWYGVEFDQDFVYLSLERCTCSLSDLIYVFSGSFQSQEMTKYQDFNLSDEFTIRLRALMENNKDVELWKENGHPSAQLLKLMRDMVSGVSHLHELGIIHRDLKPPNVLIITERSLCAKLSDMGISKRLLGDMSTLTQNATGYGSSGWQAPEQLLHGRQTRAVDLFSLGCVLFFCLTGGRHPYGDSFERDVNIVNDRKDLFLVENIPEAVDLFSRLLDPNPDMRPRAQDVLYHPLFWSSETRLSFLRDVSDRVELEDREGDSELLKVLEGIAPVALNGKWDEKMEAAFINNIGRYRRYKYDSIRDLLRVIRNKSNHYRELPRDIQELLGPIPEGFYDYFCSRFPKLLIEVYNVVYRYCNGEEFLQKYIASDRLL